MLPVRLIFIGLLILAFCCLIVARLSTSLIEVKKPILGIEVSGVYMWHFSGVNHKHRRTTFDS